MYAPRHLLAQIYAEWLYRPVFALFFQRAPTARSRRNCTNVSSRLAGFAVWLSVGWFATVAPSSLADSGTATVQAYTTGTKITPGSPVGGSRYGRVIRLQHSGSANGTLLATFEAWPNDFGIYKSTDDGLTWALIATTTETQFSGWQFKVEPDLLEVPAQMGNLPAGAVLLAGNSVNGNGHQLEIYYSLNQGVSWQYRGMVDNNAATLKGLWEPRLDVTSGGQLICYYSDERSAPTYNQLIGERVSPDGGLTWGAQTSACAISDGVQRPGMAVTTRLPNGQHVMTFEAQPGNTGQVHIKFSNDGVNWGSGPADYGTAVQTASGAYLGSCPYIAWIPAGGPNGTLVLNAQFLLNSPNTDRQLLVNTNLGQGNWTMVPAPVQWQGGGNSLAGWSQGMIPTADGQGVIHLASSQVTVNGNVNWNQMLFARQQMLLPGRNYTVANQNSKLAINVPGGTTVHGTGLQQGAVNGGPTVQWTFNDLGNNVWTVANPTNKLAWDNFNFNAAAGSIIDQWDYNANVAQQWKLRPVGDGTWKFVNVSSGLVISVASASQASGAAIVQAASAAAAEQNWLPTQSDGNTVPAAEYALDGNTLDGSGNVQSGTPSTSATTYVGSRLGTGAMQFNGVDANVQLPCTIGAGNQFTAAFWMKTTSPGGTGTQWGSGTGLVAGDFTTTNGGFGVSLLNGKVAFGVGYPATTLPSTVAVNDGKWHHVAVARNGVDGTMAIYLDGKLNASVVGSTGLHAASSSLRLGSLATGASGTFYNGILDEVRLYNGWLDAGTIANLAATPTPNAALVAEYNLEGDASDSSVFGNTGTPVGSVAFVAGKVGSQAAQFVGTTGYVAVPASVTNDFSLAYWIKTTSTGGSGSQWYNGAGLVDGDVSGVAADFGTSLLGGKVAFGIGTADGTTPTTITSAVTINDGGWHQVVATRNNASGAMKIYVDGLLQASGVGSTGGRVSPALRIGAIQSGGGFLNGTMDDVRLYSYELNAIQVAALFAPQALPAPWLNADVGSPGGAGSTVISPASGYWALAGGGSDIWLATDQFQFAYQSFSGDGVLSTQAVSSALLSDGTANANAKTGLMFRDSLAANAPFVTLVHDQGKGLQMLYRDSAGATAAQQSTTVAVSPPVWLRLVRSGNTFTAAYATTGNPPTAADWVVVGSHATSLASSAAAGLVVCAHDSNKLADAIFSGVSLSPPTPPSISAVPDQILAANAVSTALPVTLTDSLVTANNLVLRASSSNSNLVPAANIILGGAGASRSIQVATASDQCGFAVITLTADNGQPAANTATTAFRVTVPAATLGDAWRERYFGTTANTGNGADGADPDGDGTVNLMERFFGSNPLGADLPTASPMGSLQGTSFTLTYPRSLSAADLSYQVEWSSDLVSWHSGGVTDTSVSNNGSVETRTATVSASVSNPLFMRVKVMSP